MEGNQRAHKSENKYNVFDKIVDILMSAFFLFI